MEHLPGRSLCIYVRPESMYLCETNKTKPVNDMSYWSYALKYCGIFSDSTDNNLSNHKDI